MGTPVSPNKAKPIELSNGAMKTTFPVYWSQEYLTLINNLGTNRHLWKWTMYYMIQVLCYIILCMSGTLLIYKKPFVPHSLSWDRFRLKVSPPFVNFSKVCDCKISKICDISFQSFRYEKIRVCDKDSLPFNRIFR